MNPKQLANAKTNPQGSASSRTSVSPPTPATTSSNASAFRDVRAPAAASTTTPRNSMAPTVESGSRSTGEVEQGVHYREVDTECHEDATVRT